MAVLLASWTGQWFKDGLNYAGSLAAGFFVGEGSADE
jgi:hypothetical protein